MLSEVLEERVPERTGRYGPRGLKRKMSSYPIRTSRGPTKTQAPKAILKIYSK
jgi:hypothetical protein